MCLVEKKSEWASYLKRYVTLSIKYKTEKRRERWKNERIKIHYYNMHIIIIATSNTHSQHNTEKIFHSDWMVLILFF